MHVNRQLMSHGQHWIRDLKVRHESMIQQTDFSGTKV